MAGGRPPYQNDELASLAQHCTEQEDAAKKVERQVVKSAAALLLQSRIGATFDAMVTGTAANGAWVRIFHPPVEGKLEKGFAALQVGDGLRVQLIHVDVERGYIDFVRAG
jgi:exoribonuclease-2